MKKNYLLEIILALDPDEREGIASYLDFHFAQRGATGQEIKKLFSVLCGHADLNPGEEPEISREAVYHQLFGDHPHIAGKLEKLMVELNKCLREYLVLKEITTEQHKIDYQLQWISWLRKRGLGNRFKMEVARLNSVLSANRLESSEMLHARLRLTEEEYIWETDHNKITGDLNIPAVLKSLDLYYKNFKTDLLNRLILQQKAIKLQPPYASPEVQVTEQEQRESALLRVSFQVYKLLSKEKPTVEEFQSLLSVIEAHESSLSFSTNTTFNAYIRNYCTLLIDEGFVELIPTLHEIHKSGLNNGYFTENGKIPPPAYLNLVQIAIRAKSLEWARNFTETFKNRILSDSSSDFFYRINLVSLHLAEGNPALALDWLPELPSSPYYQLLVRRLELKAYYELDSELFPFKLDAFRKYVERTVPKSISEKIKNMNMDFAKVLAQLDSSPGKDKKRAAQIIQRIEAKNQIAEKSWLLEKAQEIGR